MEAKNYATTPGTITRRGNGIYLSRASLGLRKFLQSGGIATSYGVEFFATPRQPGRWFYRARLLPGFRWSGPEQHPVALSKRQPCKYAQDRGLDEQENVTILTQFGETLAVSSIFHAAELINKIYKADGVEKTVTEEELFSARLNNGIRQGIDFGGGVWVIFGGED